MQRHLLVGSHRVPEGLTYDAASHVISGTPSVAGSYVVKVTLTDGGAGLTQPFDFPLTIAQHVGFSKKPQTAFVGKKYSARLSVIGGVAPFKWRAFSKLPAGLKLDRTAGTLSGTPKTAGTFRVTLRVTDALRASTTQTIVFKVKA